nr:glutathione S-transferase GSTS12/13-1 [Brachionus angularis]
MKSVVVIVLISILLNAKSCVDLFEFIKRYFSDEKSIDYQLTYFNGRGRAELARLIFATANVQYEDIRIDYINEWPNKKKESPLGQLPFLSVNDIKLPQSIALSRLLAKRHNLAGKDDLEQAKTDAVVDTLNDYYLKVYYANEQERPAVVAKFLAEDGAVHLGRVEKILNLFGIVGFSVGSSLTWADLFVYDITSIIDSQDQNVLNNYPRILSVRNTVQSNERVAEYLKKRPNTEF